LCGVLCRCKSQFLLYSYHQTHSARDWLSILRTPYTTQNLQRKRRTIATNSSYFGLMSQLKSQLLSRKAKILICETTVRPILTYASETWTTTKNDERRLNIFGRKILRRIYGPICEGRQWGKRYNTELEEICNEPNTVTVIKSSRMRWAGHVV